MDRMLADATPFVMLILGGMVSYFFWSVKKSQLDVQAGQRDARQALDRLAARLDKQVEDFHAWREHVVAEVMAKPDATAQRKEFACVYRRLDDQARELAELRGFSRGMSKALSRASGQAVRSGGRDDKRGRVVS